jgi:hypothetical protein
MKVMEKQLDRTEIRTVQKYLLFGSKVCTVFSSDDSVNPVKTLSLIVVIFCWYF